MHIINQTKNNTCMACVMAMMVGESEQYVLDWFEHIDPPFYDEDMIIFLAHHGISLSLCGVLKKNDKGVDISKFEDIQLTINLKTHRAFMVVDSQTVKGQSHAVFWDRDHVLDPQKKKPQKLSNYKVRYIYPMMATKIRNKKRKVI